MKVHFMISAWNPFYSSYSFLFLHQKIMPMAHKACWNAQKVVRMILIPFCAIYCFKSTWGWKECIGGTTQVWILMSLKSDNLWYTDCTEQVGWIGNIVASLDRCPAHSTADRTIVLTKVFLTIPFNYTNTHCIYLNIRSPPFHSL